MSRNQIEPMGSFKRTDVELHHVGGHRCHNVVVRFWRAIIGPLYSIEVICPIDSTGD